MPVVRAQCPNCQSPIDVEYVWLGAPTTCGTCGRTDVPFVAVGTMMPVTRWELTFADFTQLLAARAGRTRLDGLLGNWYGYSIRGYDGDSTVHSSIGAQIDPIALHEWIQRDPDKQLELYQMAMDLWR